MEEKVMMSYHVETNLNQEVLALLISRQCEQRTITGERPLIAIPGYLATNQFGRWPLFGSDAPSLNVLRRLGANPLNLASIPMIEGDPLLIFTDEKAFADAFEVMWSYITQLPIQGLCLAGGGDLTSTLYYQPVGTQTNAADTWRDLWERYLALIGWLLRWPTLGLCRGMQLMNVVLGGALIQDLRSEWSSLWAGPYEMLPLIRHIPMVRKITPDTFIPHDVYVNRQSRLATLLGADGIASSPVILPACLSQHHQAVGVIMPDGSKQGPVAASVEVNACSSDGVIEGIESIPEPLAVQQFRERFYIGVQWHPEWMTEDYWAQQLFQAFTQECTLYTPLSPSQLQDLKPFVRTWVRQIDRNGQTLAQQSKGAQLAALPQSAHTTEPLAQSNLHTVHHSSAG
jgi:putative glutamine amidotransferase